MPAIFFGRERRDRLPVWSWDGIRVVLGVLLVCVAILKAQDFVIQSPTELISHRSIGNSWLALFAIQFEFLLGIWLLSAFSPRAAWAVSLATFCVFLAVALQKGTGGEASCGCFGRLKMSPWLTAAFDSGVILGLLFIRPPVADARLMKVSFVKPKLFICAVVISFGWATYLYTHRQVDVVTSADDIRTGGGILLLEPHRWHGKRLPILGNIDVGGRLATGDWLVLVYHHDCDTCEEAIPRYQAIAPAKNGAVQLALVQMPPYASAHRDPAGESAAWTNAKLSDTSEWFATTPLALALRDGIVLKTMQGKQATDPTTLLEAIALAGGNDVQALASQDIRGSHP